MDIGDLVEALLGIARLYIYVCENRSMESMFDINRELHADIKLMLCLLWEVASLIMALANKETPPMGHVRACPTGEYCSR